MGWTTYRAMTDFNGKVDRVAECNSAIEFTERNITQRVLKATMRGKIYYAAVERIENGAREVFAAVFITCGKPYKNAYENFGYKGMTEYSGPFYYDCPKNILNLLTPTDNEYALAWREKCRETLAKRKVGNPFKTLPYGAKIIHTRWNGEKVTLTKHAPYYQFKTWFWYNEENNTYISKKYVTEENAEIIA